jgi:Cu/Ag efflux protein CusF
MKRAIFPVLAMFTISACGNGTVEAPASDASATNGAIAAAHTEKAQGPVQIDYKIIGIPIVGQPVGIDLQVLSKIGPQEMTLSYRVNDSTALQFAETQLDRVTLAATQDDRPSLQQVQVIPLREGRVFLNVSVSIETDNGTMSSVTAIPIQVGAAAREPQDNGELLTDESGEQVRSLPAKED